MGKLTENNREITLFWEWLEIGHNKTRYEAHEDVGEPPEGICVAPDERSDYTKVTKYELEKRL